MFYDRKIKYLDYMENGDKVRSAGFVKMEVAGENCNVQVSVNGLYKTDTLRREVWICGGGKEAVLGEIDLDAGKGSFALKKIPASGLSGERISYNDLESVRIRLAKNRELICRWGENTSGRNTGVSRAEDGFAQDAVPRGRDIAGKQQTGSDGARGETKEIEELRLEALRPEILRPEKLEPAAVWREVLQSAAVRPEAVSSNTVPSHEIGIESVRPEELRSETVRSEAVRQEEVKPEAAGSETVQLQEVQTGSVPYQNVQAKLAQAENGPDWDGVSDENGGDGLLYVKWMQKMDTPQAEGGILKEQNHDAEENVIFMAPKETERDGLLPEDSCTSNAVFTEPRQPDTPVSQKNPTVPPNLFEDKWKQLSCIYPHISPFHDGRDYLSIGPGDFVILPRKYHKLVTNSFLLHGYYNYEHLILARVMRKGEEYYYLGVPGNFYDREKQVALMFGFESFECKTEPAQTGDYGYFMMRVDI